MRISNVKFVLSLFLIASLFEACTENESLIDSETQDLESIVEETTNLSDDTSILISDWLSTILGSTPIAFKAFLIEPILPIPHLIKFSI